MANIEPDRFQRAKLLAAAADNPEPVVMINLLRFGPNTYQRYANEVQPFLESVGATVLYAGDASHVVAGDIDRPFGTPSWWSVTPRVRHSSQWRPTRTTANTPTCTGKRRWKART